LGNVEIEEAGPLRVVLKVDHPISKTSKLMQRIIFTAHSAKIEFDTKVSWNENRKMLKVEFPVNISNDFATYESQVNVNNLSLVWICAKTNSL
jgi:alpha-mannosidase